jgi:hypothetical protein|tara:strand:- start:1421 stop:1678 length:258 start_codon:yes stop_codon:yes gene_type:complete
MAKVKKLSKEELAKVTELTNKANQIAMQLGSLDVQKSLLREQFKENNVLIEESKKELMEKYGNISIDLQDGTISETEEVVAKDGK